jgi:two-component system alkaline phosphatase synthesis response regulator PhoP
MTRTILVVDDEKRLCDLVRAYLTQEGFHVLTASNGQQALYVARHEKPDLILLDLMMPEMTGYEFMHTYAREGDAPIIILTAKIEEQDKVLGLELGADDYVTKPFSMRELTARVRAVLRRMDKARPTTDVLRAADITLDRVGRVVTVGDARVDLTPSEFDLLATLMSAPGRAFTRFDLLESIQGDAYAGYQRTIDVHVRNLRMKIEPDPSQPRYVESVYGVGYRFTADS